MPGLGDPEFGTTTESANTSTSAPHRLGSQDGGRRRNTPAVFHVALPEMGTSPDDVLTSNTRTTFLTMHDAGMNHKRWN